jgi:hypothetical protein
MVFGGDEISVNFLDIQENDNAHKNCERTQFPYLMDIILRKQNYMTYKKYK